MSKPLLDLMSKTKRLKPDLESERRSFQIRKYCYQKKVPVFPLVMMVETTGKCNQGCLICPRQAITRSLAGNMDFNLFTKVIDESRYYDGYPSQITLHFSGEPLITPAIWRFINYAKVIGEIPFVRFNSNGMLLTKQISKKLILSGLDRLTIAIEPKRETHNRIRIGSNYDVVAKNITEFMKLKKYLKLDKPQLWIQFLFSEFTSEQDIIEGLHDWEDIVDYVEVESVSTIAGLVPDMGSLIKRSECYDVWIQAAILWNGDVTTCCADHNGEFVMGNVSKSSIKELWDSAKWAALRNLHKKNKLIHLPSLCQNCIEPISKYAKLKRKVRRIGWRLLKAR